MQCISVFSITICTLQSHETNSPFGVVSEELFNFIPNLRFQILPKSRFFFDWWYFIVIIVVIDVVDTRTSIEFGHYWNRNYIQNLYEITDVFINLHIGLHWMHSNVSNPRIQQQSIVAFMVVCFSVNLLSGTNTWTIVSNVLYPMMSKLSKVKIYVIHKVWKSPKKVSFHWKFHSCPENSAIWITQNSNETFLKNFRHCGEW